MSDDELLKALELAVSQKNMAAANEIGLLLKQSRQRNEPLPPPAQLGQAGMPDAIKSTIREQFGKPAQVLAGAGSATMVAGHAAANLVGADNDAAMQNWKAVSGATPYTTGGNIAGNVGMFGVAPAGAVGAGMRMAGRTLPRLGAVADMVGTQGVLAAVTTPGDASERIKAAMLGMGGAAVPGVVGAVQGARRMTTNQGSRLGLAEGLRRELGQNADGLAVRLDGTYPASRYGVNPSSAMLTRHPTLEALETGSRTRTGDQWTRFDRMNAEARWGAIEGAAGTPAELATIRAARDALSSPKRVEALGATGGALKVGKGSPYGGLTEKLESLTTGAERPNPSVQAMVGYVNKELEKGVTPEQLYSVRKFLTEGYKSGPPSELANSVKGANFQRREIIEQLDNVLDDMSGGKWADYLKTYKEASPLINSRESLLKIKGSLEKNLPTGMVPPVMGEKVRPTALGAALRQFGEKQFGTQTFDRLLPADRQMLTTLLEDMHNQAGVLSSATKMGSPTAPLTANAGRVNALTSGLVDETVGKIPLVGNNLGASVKGSMARTSEEALAELLKNPKLLAETLRRAKEAGELLRRSGQVGAGAGAGARSGME